MRLALDIDGTISSAPEIFLFLAKAWVAKGGEVHIVSARSIGDTWITQQHLKAWGFGEIAHQLHLYPHHYDYQNPEAMDRHHQNHSAWKAETCLAHGIDVLIDDDPRNLIAVREAGIYSLSAGFVIGAEADPLPTGWHDATHLEPHQETPDCPALGCLSPEGGVL